MGPRANTGKYVRPTTMTAMPASISAKIGVPVGKVPDDAGTLC
jgi:hypothetical protein